LHGHSLGRSLALAYLREDSAGAGEGYAIEILGKAKPAEPLAEPPYDPKGERLKPNCGEIGSLTLVDAAFTRPKGLVNSRTSDQVGAQPAWRLSAIEGSLQGTLGIRNGPS
jgi:hypothetical protein